MGESLLGQSRPENNRNEGVLHIDQSSLGQMDLRVMEMKAYSTGVKVLCVRLYP